MSGASDFAAVDRAADPAGSRVDPGRDGPLGIDVRRSTSGMTTMRVSGEVDMHTAPYLATVLDDACRAARPSSNADLDLARDARGAGARTARVVCDLSEVEFLGAAGLGVLLTAADGAVDHEAELVVVIGSRPVRRALAAAGMDRNVPRGLRLVDLGVPRPVTPESAYSEAVEPAHLDEMVTAMGHAASRFTRHSTIRDRDHALREIVPAALEAIPGAGHAGLTVYERGGRLTSTGPTNQLVARLDQAQAVLHEGPCVTVATSWVVGAVDATATTSRRDEPMVWIDEMDDEDDGGRWPRFADEAIRNRVMSMLSVRLPSHRRDRAVALNLYADRPSAFDPAARAVAALVADQAGITLLGAERADQLEKALATRDVIGQAKGILMQRRSLSSDDAFAKLVEASQDHNIKVVDVARWLVADLATDARAVDTTAEGPASVSSGKN